MIYSLFQDYDAMVKIVEDITALPNKVLVTATIAIQYQYAFALNRYVLTEFCWGGYIKPTHKDNRKNFLNCVQNGVRAAYCVVDVTCQETETKL